MKFVHLTSYANIGRIKKSGLRMGGGMLGRGVYAVPLMKYKYYKGLEEWRGDKTIEVEPVSSSRIWRFLFRDRFDTGKGKRVAVIVFELPEDCWPVSAYLEPTVQEIRMKLYRYLLRKPVGITIDEDNIQEISDYLRIGNYFNFIPVWASVESPKSLGKLWSFVHRGGSEGEWNQVVIRKPIPATYITKIVPLYRTSAEHRKSRDLAGKQNHEE